jgi:hypothetical protein
MKTFKLTVAVAVEIQVPDEHPGDVYHFRRMLDWKGNDCCDGRYPFWKEQIDDGVERGVARAIEESAFQLLAEGFKNPLRKCDFAKRDALVGKATKDARVVVAHNLHISSVRLVVKDASYCEQPGCHEMAETAAEPGRVPGEHSAQPGVYCEAHADMAVERGTPEYKVSCPNCGCYFGVG